MAGGNDEVETNIGEEQQEPEVDKNFVLEEVNALPEACQPLYCGAQSSMLAATMLLMNVCQVHVSNKFVDKLLSLLHKHLFPIDNCLPSTLYQAKALTSKVGLRYNNIHARSNGCVLFQKEYSLLQACPKCGAACYRPFGRSQVPMKVLQHFPLAS